MQETVFSAYSGTKNVSPLLSPRSPLYLPTPSRSSYSFISDRYVYIPTDTSNPRVITDAEFFGHLSTLSSFPSSFLLLSSPFSCPFLLSASFFLLSFTFSFFSPLLHRYTHQHVPWKSKSVQFSATCPGGSSCSGNGACIDGQCVCELNYLGWACQVYATPGNTYSFDFFLSFFPSVSFALIFFVWFLLLLCMRESAHFVHYRESQQHHLP